MLSFLEKGGSVLVVIFALSVLLFSLIVDRFFVFYLTKKPTSLDLAQKQAYKQSLNAGMFFFDFNILVAPLLGLLGTVTGMIEVFGVIQIYGNAEPKLMADGISKATIPTMTGLSLALVAIFAKSFLSKRQKTLSQKADKL